MSQKTKLDQKGFASIVIAMILIVVMALITVGFAQLARREQQSSLDKQLASQASYAAESGFNDVYHAVFGTKTITPLMQTGTSTSTTYNPNKCLTPGFIAATLGQSSVIDPNTGTGYSCVLLNLIPKQLSWNDVAPGESKDLYATVPLATGVTLTSLTINWTSADGHSSYPSSSSTQFTPFGTGAGTWNSGGSGNPSASYPPVLQFSLTPLGASFDRTSLVNGTYTFYLYPSGGGTTKQDCNSTGGPNLACYYISGTSLPTSQAPILHGGCQPGQYSSYDCSATIIVPPTSSSYLIHFLDFYDSANVAVTGETSVGGAGSATFLGQAVIDVTGQARNVLKRVQIVASPQASYNPSQAVQAQNICKRAQTYPGVTDFLGPTYSNANGQTDACNPETNP